jgi:hypothetical protein
MPILVFLLAFSIPAYLAYRFHSHSWIWHALAIAAALVLGFVPMPPEWQSKTFDLILGATVASLIVWGITGLFAVERHHRYSPGALPNHRFRPLL